MRFNAARFGQARQLHIVVKMGAGIAKPGRCNRKIWHFYYEMIDIGV
jgi:hypothetical protein